MVTLRLLALTVGAIAALHCSAVEYAECFADSTLRIDYIMGGNAAESRILLKSMKKMPGWYGRRGNLDKLPVLGNGTVTVTDSLSGDTIYRHSFSTLFNEWQATDEARNTSKSFENSFLVPLPLHAAYITTELLNNRHERVAANTHLYSSDDILVSRKINDHPAPYHYIYKGGDPKDAIDIVILAEGFRKEEMPEFNAKALETMDALFSHEPFKSRKEDFNIVVLETPSNDSGMSVPRNNVWKNTAFDSSFDTFYSARYLTTGNVFRVYDAAEHVPFEHIIILANSPVYGGGGIYNSYELTTTGHDKFRPVVVHEFGHSFGGLADEYFYEGDVMEDSYPFDVEPWEPNITTLVEFDSKWKDMLTDGTAVPTPVKQASEYPVGVYEGGGYSSKHVYRPADHCRMRDNETTDFCPVCQRALSDMIDFYTR